MSVETKLPPELLQFDPNELAVLETVSILDDSCECYYPAYLMQVGMVQQQFGLSEAAAQRVVHQSRPNELEPAIESGLPGYFQQLGKETGLGFQIDPEIFEEKLSAGKLARLWSAVYGVDEEKLLPVMEVRVTALTTSNYDNGNRWEDNFRKQLVTYYTLLKEVLAA